MIPDEFKFFVLNTATSWREGLSESLRIASKGQISLWPRQDVTQFATALGHATGFAVDPCGNLFVIDAQQCRFYKFTLVDKKFAPLACLGECGAFPGQFRFTSPTTGALAGNLALSHSSLYVADTFNHRVQAFYPFNLQIRFILGATDQQGSPMAGNRPGEFNEPRDIVVDRKGNFYVLDSGNRRIQKFNRYGRFLGLVGEGVVEEPVNLAIAQNDKLDQEDALYVSDAATNRLFKFDQQGRVIWDLALFKMLGKDFQPSGLAVDSQQLIYIGQEGRSDKLHVHIFDHSPQYLGHFGDYAGACYQLLADKQGNLYANWGPEGTVVRMPSENAEAFVRQGVYYSKAFDSTMRECQWHRLALEATIPGKTKIEISYFLSDDHKAMAQIPASSWKPLLSTPRNGLDAKEGLFLEGRGQYLRLRIALFGDEAHTPTIRQARIFFPRLSYLRYLPATYQEDEIGREFMERYLAMFEAMAFDMEQRIAQIARYFDPAATDKGFLNWLASWLAISADENWTEEKKRAVLAAAYLLYKRRGTLHGLREMVKLFTNQTPMLLEHHRIKSPMVVGEQSQVGRSTMVAKAFTKRLVLEETSTIGDFVLAEEDDSPEKPFAAEAHAFTILLNTSEMRTPEQRATLQRLIDAEKPAHTRSFLRTSTGEMKLGAHAMVEVDTQIGKGFPLMRLGAESLLGINTFLGTKYPVKGTIASRSKIAVDMILH